MYLYDGLEVVQELAGPHLEHVTAYYRAGESIIASQGYTAQLGGESYYTHRPEGRQLYYAYDALGSVASLANYAGQERERYQYLAFGSLIAGDVTINAYTFTGREFDPESELYHFHFRQYDAVVGVWTAPDPIGLVAGLNYYQYVLNNPIIFIDALGLCQTQERGFVGQVASATKQAVTGAYQAVTSEKTVRGAEFGFRASGVVVGYSARTAAWNAIGAYATLDMPTRVSVGMMARSGLSTFDNARADAESIAGQIIVLHLRKLT